MLPLRICACRPLRLRVASAAVHPVRPKYYSTPQLVDPNDAASNKSSSDSMGKMAIQAMLTVTLGTALIAISGMGYHYGYKQHVLRKMRNAFEAGFDPVLELENAAKETAAQTRQKQFIGIVDGDEQDEDRGQKIQTVIRKEQELIDAIISGRELGHYWLITGPKGTGKSSMIIKAMVANNAEGCAMAEAHEDPEVFRLRIGKALDFEFSEDSFAGLFSRRDPREAGPLLDIERAMNKLEKVAIQYRKEKKRPLVLVINNIHLIHDDEDGWALLHLLQQRAESWAAAGCATMIFNTDDFWCYNKLRKNASRMSVLGVDDLKKDETVKFILNARSAFEDPSHTQNVQDAEEIYSLVGGRLNVLNSLVKKKDMASAAKDLIAREKGWLLSKIGLIVDHDDDVMDEQKFATTSQLLVAEFAKIANELEEKALADGEDPAMVFDQVKMTWERARQVMTRPDFLGELDSLNVVHVNTHYELKPDSILLLNVFKEIAAEEGFEEKLEAVMQRVNDIESLHRTREITLKDKPDAEGVLKLMLTR